jgi:hypothetical protein
MFRKASSVLAGRISWGNNHLGSPDFFHSAKIPVHVRRIDDTFNRPLAGSVLGDGPKNGTAIG